MKKLFLLLLLFPFLLGCSQKEKEFTVLQWNIWQEGTVIPGGYNAIVNEIAMEHLARRNCNSRWLRRYCE